MTARRLRQQPRDPYRPAYRIILAVSPQIRARHPASPLSLDEALRKGHGQPQELAPADSGPSFWAELPGNAASPSRARAAVRQVLTSWGLASLIPDTELLASELVANAAESAPGCPIGLSIRKDTTPGGLPGVTCEVTDRSAQLPRIQPAHPGSERGRGLAIVAALATGSGYTARPGGKTAWFTLATPEPDRAAEPGFEAGA